MKQKRSDREMVNILGWVALPILFAVASALWLLEKDQALHNFILVMGAFMLLIFVMNYALRRMWAVAAVLLLLALLLAVAVFLPDWEQLPLEWTTKFSIDLWYFCAMI